MRDRIFKILRNICPLFRGWWFMIGCLLRNNIFAGKLIRIGSGTRIICHPGCRCSFGNRLVIGGGSTVSILSKGKFEIGDDSSIGGGNCIICHNKITIGNGTLLGPGIMIYDHNHKFDSCNGVHRKEFDVGEISIGNNCWIGARSIILKNVHIGDHSIIGAGSIVTKDIPNGCLAVGSPAKVIKHLN